MLAFRAGDSVYTKQKMVLVSLLFFVYFGILFLFSLVSHPVYYCGFLVANALICSLICYSVFGFRWYSVLFCLVYIGGVYILFVFVSVYRPNRSYATHLKIDFSSLLLLTFMILLVGYSVASGVLAAEFSRYLCTGSEGAFYVVCCLMLLFGFLVLRMVMSVKLNYYR